MTLLIIIVAIFGVCFVVERLAPGWKLPPVPTWTLRVLSVNFIQLGVVILAGLTWEKWLLAHSLFHLSEHMGPLTGGVLAYFLATFLSYWWHRWRHSVNFLWTHFHQVHHSAQRVEVITTFYKHPLEMLANGMIGSVFIYTFLGLNTETGAIYTLLITTGEFFYHLNVKTPCWIGYVFQRPEMHRIHHQYNKHTNNFGDIVWWDMLFGTYENPKDFTASCGFDNDKEQRLMDMLKFKDVNKEDSI